MDKKDKMETRSNAKSTNQSLESMNKAELDFLKVHITEQGNRLTKEKEAFNAEKRKNEQEMEERQAKLQVEKQRLEQETIERQERLRKREEEFERRLLAETSREQTRDLLYDENEDLSTMRRNDRGLGPQQQYPDYNPRDSKQRYLTPEPIPAFPDEMQTPRVTFREALETVPVYDGYNMTVSQFARACNRAKEIIPPSSERNLVRLLCNKLKGRALVAVEDEPCHNVEQLIDLLTIAFGSRKNLDQYRGELSNIYMRPNEHIMDYIRKVKDLRSNIVEEERRKYGNRGTILMEDTDKFVATSFCEGLPSEYRLQFSLSARQNPNMAYREAQEIASRIELDKSRHYKPSYDRKQPINNYTTPKLFNPQQNNHRAPRQLNYAPEEYKMQKKQSHEKKCEYCKKTGHLIDTCWTKQRFEKLKQQGNGTDPSRKWDATRADPSKRMRPINTINITKTQKTK